jgi:hypothetical protein
MLVAAAATVSAGQAGSKNYKGLEMTVAGVERTTIVTLSDCPPGSNTVKGTTRPGEEFAVVSVAFKVGAGFKETLVKKPVLADAAGKTYNTAVSFIDPASKPEYTCTFPFRLAEGTRLKSLQIDTVTLDLAAFDVKKP